MTIFIMFATILVLLNWAKKGRELRGIQATMVSRGVMLNQVRGFLALAPAPWLLAHVGLVFLSVLSFNALGDGLRDSMDPYYNV